MIAKYEIGDCFTAETYGELAEYVVVSSVEKRDYRNYGLYCVSLNKGASIDIKQRFLLSHPKLDSTVRKDVVNLHWLTFDELADMLVDMGDGIQVIGYVNQDDAKVETPTSHLFIKHKNRIIQISVPHDTTVNVEYMLRFVYVKVITEEELNRIASDSRWKFFPTEGICHPCHPIRVDKYSLYEFLGVTVPCIDVEVHGVILSRDFAIVDHNDFDMVDRKKSGLCTSFSFWRHYNGI